MHYSAFLVFLLRAVIQFYRQNTATTKVRNFNDESPPAGRFLPAASKSSSELSVAALSFLSGVASSEDGLAKLQEHDAFGVVVEVRIEEFLTSSCSSIPLC